MWGLFHRSVFILENFQCGPVGKALALEAQCDSFCFLGSSCIQQVIMYYDLVLPLFIMIFNIQITEVKS